MPDEFGRLFPWEVPPAETPPQNWGMDALRPGSELLKGRMLEDLGVDYQKGGPFDDTPTFREGLRRTEQAKPDIGIFRETQKEMEKELSDEWHGDEPWSPSMQQIQYHLEPVEHNPHNPAPVTLEPYAGSDPHNPQVALEPTDEDPWAAAGIKGDAKKAAQQLQTTEAERRQILNNLVRSGPGRVAAPNPYPPGSEQWEFYEQSRSSGISQAGARTALDLIGGGARFAERGAVGAAGGKLGQILQHFEKNFGSEKPAAFEQRPATAEHYIGGEMPNTPASVHFDPDKPTLPAGWSTADEAGYQQALKSLKEATTPSYKIPRPEDFAPHLRPLEWQEQRPALKEALHPAERQTYEQLLAEPERAKKAYMAGFNINKPLYKGGREEYPEVVGDPAKEKAWERGLFLADKPDVAENYGAVTPYVARAQNAHEIDWHEATGQPHYQSHEMHAIVEAGHAKKADLLVIRNILDMGGKQDQYVVLNPNILRAPHAKFDWDKLHHAMPLAGIAGGGAIVLDQDGDIVHYIKGDKTRADQ